MARIKKGLNAQKRRRNVLKQVKGYRFGRSKKEAAAKEALAHAYQYAFGHRRDKKRDMRALFQTKIGAESKKHGISFSKLMGNLKKKNVELDRKVLATLAADYPKVFEAVAQLAISGI
ncbi:MAG: 50S ribosomal protein L20 [Candidatus Paceibacterota bacterium]|jgi:large subunit ribosomal protein L20